MNSIITIFHIKSHKTYSLLKKSPYQTYVLYIRLFVSHNNRGLGVLLPLSQ